MNYKYESDCSSCVYVFLQDVFQKYYARALARRLIHQLSASMELVSIYYC